MSEDGKLHLGLQILHIIAPFFLHTARIYFSNLISPLRIIFKLLYLIQLILQKQKQTFGHFTVEYTSPTCSLTYTFSINRKGEKEIGGSLGNTPHLYVLLINCVIHISFYLTATSVSGALHYLYLTEIIIAMGH